MVVLDNGSAMLYNVLGNLVRTFFILPPSSINQVVVQLVVWGPGLAALTNTMALHVCDDVSVVTPKVYQMTSGLSSTRPAISMVVLHPRFTSSGLVEIMLSTVDRSVVIVDSNGPEDQLLQERIKAPIIEMAVAPNGRFLACFTATGILTVMSTSFTTKVLDFDTSTTSAPLQIRWCGEDSVILYWKHFLLLVGPYGHWLKFPYMSALYIIAEADCCRVITDHFCELLQRVPGPIEMIHRIGSTHASAMLYDAMEAFEDGEAKANEHVRSIDSPEKLNGAIKANILAALAEFEPSQQKRYLYAAIYGKSFCKGGDLGTFLVAAARKLRVLNHVRRIDPAVFLTALQYEWLSPTTLVDRLLARNGHVLALSTCQYLGMAQDRVLIHWACARLRASVASPILDEQLQDVLENRLSFRCSSISYAQIAAAADIIGRRRLATILLEHETHSTERVKLLLTMREFECALQQAVIAMEVDVIYLALLIIERSLSSTRTIDNDTNHTRIIFYSLTNTHVVTCNLLHVYYREYARKVPKLLHNSLMNTTSAAKFLEAGNLAIATGYREILKEDRCKRMREAIALFAQFRESQFQAKQTEEQIELLGIQSELENRLGVSCFLDMSVTETIYNLIALGATQLQHAAALQSDALKIQRRFKVSDLRFSHIKVKALAASGQWDAFHVFANERRPPIGYLPFVNTLLSYSQPALASSMYIEQIPSAEDRFNLFFKLKLWQSAIETAVRLNDLEKLNQVHASCDDPRLRVQIDERSARLELKPRRNT